MKTSNGKLNYRLFHLGTIPCQNGLYFDGYSLHWIIGDTYMQNHAQYTSVICTVSLLLYNVIFVRLSKPTKANLSHDIRQPDLQGLCGENILKYASQSSSERRMEMMKPVRC